MPVMEWLNGQIAELEEQKVALETELAASKAEGKVEGDAEGYARGLEEGRGSIQLPDPSNPDAQYTQDQMNTAVSEREAQVRSEMGLEIEDVKLQLAAAVDEVAKVKLSLEEVQAATTAAVEGAVTAFKAELKAKYDEQQVAESQGETGFGALLG